MKTQKYAIYKTESVKTPMGDKNIWVIINNIFLKFVYVKSQGELIEKLKKVFPKCNIVKEKTNIVLYNKTDKPLVLALLVDDNN